MRLRLVTFAEATGVSAGYLRLRPPSRLRKIRSGEFETEILQFDGTYSRAGRRTPEVPTSVGASVLPVETRAGTTVTKSASPARFFDFPNGEQDFEGGGT